MTERAGLGAAVVGGRRGFETIAQGSVHTCDGKRVVEDREVRPGVAIGQEADEVVRRDIVVAGETGAVRLPQSGEIEALRTEPVAGNLCAGSPTASGSLAFPGCADRFEQALRHQVVAR